MVLLMRRLGPSLDASVIERRPGINRKQLLDRTSRQGD
jgi:hypothetical protein